MGGVLRFGADHLSESADRAAAETELSGEPSLDQTEPRRKRAASVLEITAAELERALDLGKLRYLFLVVAP